jgi:hypothetical protein
MSALCQFAFLPKLDYWIGVVWLFLQTPNLNGRHWRPFLLFPTKRAVKRRSGHRHGQLGHQAVERFYGRTIGEDLLRQHAFIGAQMIAQNALHYCTQIGRGF